MLLHRLWGGGICANLKERPARACLQGVAAGGGGRATEPKRSKPPRVAADYMAFGTFVVVGGNAGTSDRRPIVFARVLSDLRRAAFAPSEGVDAEHRAICGSRNSSHARSFDDRRAAVPPVADGARCRCG